VRESRGHRSGNTFIPGNASSAWSGVPGEEDRARRREGNFFIGRERELAELGIALDEALDGRGRLVLLAGQPGIGKSRTAAELASTARRRGCQVLVGRCYEGEGAPAYWPWVQILRAYFRDCDPATLEGVRGPVGANIAQILPSLRERLPDLPPVPPLPPEQGRFLLFDSVTTFLTTAARRQPLVVILDDLHWADKASLLLLTFLVDELQDSQLLVIGTYRDEEVDGQHPLAASLGQLVRQDRCSRLPLSGLNEPDVARFIALTAGCVPSPVLVAAVFRETEGNPFFIIEVVRLLRTQGRLDDESCDNLSIPDGVREVIGRRLRRLSEECNRLLALAAVVGREFNLPVLERVSGLARPHLLAVLEEALVARIITTPPQGSAGRYRFAHALIRETLYEGLGTPRRGQLHRQIGEALEALYVPAADPRLDEELAHHFFQGAVSGGVEPAVTYAVRAARHAITVLAYDEAAGHYQRALQALELAAPVDAGRRGELLVALGEAQVLAGATAQARLSFEHAATLARRLPSPELLARAALGLAGHLGTPGLADADTLALLEEVLGALPETDSVLRARVMGRFAWELCYSEAWGRQAAVSEAAVAIARRLGDVATLAYALTARRNSRSPRSDYEGRQGDIDEFLRCAGQCGSGEIALEAVHIWRMEDFLEEGDIAGFAAELEMCARAAEERRHPLYRLWTLVFRAMHALLEGRFGDAERLAVEFLAMGQRVHEQSAMVAFGAQLGVRGRLCGPLEDLVPAGKQFIAQYPGLRGTRALLAVISCELGQIDEARQEFERLAQYDFADLPENHLWLSTVALLAEVCAALGDARRAARLYDLLLPCARRTVTIGLAYCDGSVARHLGLLATTMGHWEDAERHFRNALAMNARMGARPFVALTEEAHAAMLLARGRPGDHADARAMLERVLATARTLGMTVVEERVSNVLHTAGTARECTHVAPEIGLIRDGDYWTIEGGTSTFRLNDSVGLRCLAQLLSHPGSEFLALDLWGTALGGSPVNERDTGQLLDAEATADYRRRLDDLRAELEEAEAFNDPERADRLAAEREFVVRELARAVGLGGRARKAGSAAERARVNVTRAIKRAMDRIAAHDAALAQHLAVSLKTGTFCRYTPAAT
jgi:tetratricopeptide (TPR) repeat protein